MPNWNRIKKLRDYLVAEEADAKKKLKRAEFRKFNMRKWLTITSGKLKNGGETTLGTIRKNGPSCGRATCLAGDAFILFANSHIRLTALKSGTVISPVLFIDDEASRLLGLTDSESGFVFYGNWNTSSKSGNLLAGASRERAIKYLTRAINEKNIFVMWNGSTLE